MTQQRKGRDPHVRNILATGIHLCGSEDRCSACFHVSLSSSAKDKKRLIIGNCVQRCRAPATRVHSSTFGRPLAMPPLSHTVYEGEDAVVQLVHRAAGVCAPLRKAVGGIPDARSARPGAAPRACCPLLGAAFIPVALAGTSPGRLPGGRAQPAPHHLFMGTCSDTSRRITTANGRSWHAAHAAGPADGPTVPCGRASRPTEVVQYRLLPVEMCTLQHTRPAAPASIIKWGMNSSRMIKLLQASAVLAL